MDQDVFFSLAFANVSCGKTFVQGKSHYFPWALKRKAIISLRQMASNALPWGKFIL